MLGEMLSVSANEVYDFALSVWVELFFMACFCLGFAFVRTKQKTTTKRQIKGAQVFKSVHSKATSGNASVTVSSWRAVQTQQLTPSDTLRIVVQAFLDSDRSSLVADIQAHLSCHSSDSSCSKAAVAALEVVARDGDEDLMEELYHALTRRLRFTPNAQMQEVLLGGYATVGNKTKITNLIDQMHGAKQKVTVRGYSLMMKGFLKNNMLDDALVQLREMRSQRLNVPSFAVPELFRVARQCGRSVDVFTIIVDKEVLLTSATIGTVLEDCLKSQDVALAKNMEEFATQSNLQLGFSAYECLLKLYASAGDLRAIDLFDTVVKSFPYITDGLCAGLIARCAEQKFLRFADHLASVVRSRGQMTLIAYSALMKVYSHCNMYGAACDLYHQLVAEGLEPDSTMYGCLMKFSAECGRTDLTRELSAKMPCNKLGVHHHMSLIRAAGQDKDVDKAFSVLSQFRDAGGLDTAVCNAVLDVCCSVRNMDRAWQLVVEMKKDNLLDIISYNTLVKGYCMLGDSARAHQVVVDMEKDGFQPNDITYNCLINMAATVGDFKAAWKTISTMEEKSIRIDHYTVSTLLKALKRAPPGKGSIDRVLDLLDRHQIDVCCEEVLLNTALEACVKHGEHRRLENLLGSIKSRDGMQLAAHTYANLIKASGVLKRLQQCRDLWAEMTEVRCILPTGVALGCMLDALVCNDRVQEGLALFRKWHGRVEANTVLYSTLIKGFNNIGDTKGAVEMWIELRSLKLPVNTMVFNAIIDVHARAGATAEIAKLMIDMRESSIQPDGITRSIVAKGYCVSGELEKAVEVLRSLPSERGTNNVIVYNTVLDGCVRHNRMELADELIANIETFNVVPTNFTLGIMVKMWGRRRKLGEAFKAVRTLPRQYGFTPNTPVKTCLLFACLRNDAVTGALEVFEELKSAGHRVDSKMYSALINNCSRVGQAERAVSLVEEAYGLSAGKRVLHQNDQLENACLEQLMKCLSKQGEMRKLGAPLLGKMATHKIPVSSSVIALSTA